MGDTFLDLSCEKLPAPPDKKCSPVPPAGPQCNAARGFRAVGKRSVVRAGTRPRALRATAQFVGTAYCEVLPAVEAHSHAKKRCTRAEMRGQTRKANV